MNQGDEELLELIRRALRPERSEAVMPPSGAVTQLRESVSTHFARRRIVRHRGARVAVAASIFVGLSGSAAGAFASGATLPTPLRVVARGVGLPVDSVGLAQAKTDADRLRGALDKRERAEISVDAAALESSFKGLSGHDRRSIGREVDGLLDRAEPYDGRGDDGPGSVVAPLPGGASPGGGAPVSGSDGDDGGAPATFVPQGTVTPSKDAGGGDGGGGGGGDGSSTTSTTAAPSGSGDASSPTTTSGTGGGDGTSDGGSDLQTDGDGH